MTADTSRGSFPEITVHHRLRIAREWAEMDQRELASVTGIARNTISNYELGTTARVKRPYVAQIALATGVPLEWILTGDMPQAPDGDDGCAARDSNPEPAGLSAAPVIPIGRKQVA
ncbi:MAG: helix-turn-helix domain-containing protein [Frankiales bacterium]|nr:helix-turn-helix domain-containing protein [Frankiales bacterium]